MLLDASARTPSSRATWGSPTLGRERATNPFLQELSQVSLQAPRGTFDVLPEQAAAAAVEETAAGAGVGRLPAHRDAGFEATELFARGVGESTDIVQKEMYTLDDGGGRSLTLRPEGTAPVCRAYLEHGMHKLPQPVKLWYLSSFFRHERRRPGATASSGRSAPRRSAPTTRRSTPSSIVLLRTMLEELGVRDLRLRLTSLGTPDSRAVYREGLQEYLRAHEDQLSARCASASTSTHCAPSTPTTPGRRR